MKIRCQWCNHIYEVKGGVNLTGRELPAQCPKCKGFHSPLGKKGKR